MKSGERAMDAPGAKRASEEGSSSHSVGQYLANQRRLRRISLEELSERTRIPRRNLERLESGAFDATADGFTRGFVRTVAEALGLDADDAVMRLVDEPHHADELRALIAARRAVMWRVAALAAVAVLVLVGAVYLVLHPPAHEDAKPALTWRRDAVRGLAEHEQRESGSAPAPQRAAP